MGSAIKIENKRAYFELVEVECTQEVIQAFLRRYKPLDTKNVRVSAENKNVLVHNNLRTLISRGIASEESALNLLREAEENGAQHIFLYKAKSKRLCAKYAKARDVFSSLQSAGSIRATLLPRFSVLPPSEMWADMRVDEIANTKKTKWVAKAYARRVKWRRVESETTGTERRTTDHAEPHRAVWLARYHPDGLLEVRIPRWESRKAVLEMRDAFWTMLSPAIDEADFDLVDLRIAQTRILRQHQKCEGFCRPGDTLLGGDGFGTVRYSPFSGDEGLFDHLQRERSLAPLLKTKEACEQLVVYWKPSGSSKEDSREMRTVFGGLAENEFTIGRKASSNEIDNVLNRLRTLGS